MTKDEFIEKKGRRKIIINSKNMKFPKKIYVQIEEEGNGEHYLNAHFEPEEADDGKVAIYELKEIKEKSTETHLN